MKRGISKEKEAARERAYMDGLCDRHAAERLGMKRTAYQAWRGGKMGYPDNQGLCEECKKEPHRIGRPRKSA